MCEKVTTSEFYGPDRSTVNEYGTKNSAIISCLCKFPLHAFRVTCRRAGDGRRRTGRRDPKHRCYCVSAEVPPPARLVSQDKGRKQVLV